MQNPHQIIQYIIAVFNLVKAFIKNSNGNYALYDDNGNKVNGITFQFLYQGMRDPYLTPYVAWFVETLEGSRCYIPGTIKIAQYLKAKRYSINFATNKDRISYNLTAQAFGNEFTNIPTKVFLAHPGNSAAILAQIKEFADHPTTPA